MRPRRQHGRRRLLLAGAAVVLVLGAGAAFIRLHRADPSAQSDKVKVIPQVAHHPTPVAATPRPVVKNFGIAAGSGLAGLSDAQLEKRLSDIEALGTTWIRYDFDWSNIQPDSATSYNWTDYDRLVSASNRHHLKILAILDFTPRWARPDGCDDSHCHPADNARFAQFAGQTVKRYKSQGISSWEIWNEPNNPQFWLPKADPASYTDMLARTYNAIHAQDASATVITGGLSPQSTGDTSYAPVDFLKAVYANGGQHYFDAVADHPYTFPFSPASSDDHAWNQMARASNSIHSTMVQNGDESKKVWITEFGAPTGGPGAIATITAPNTNQHPYAVDEALQAKILSDALGLYKSYDWVGPFFYYSYQDAGTTNDTNENFFGLVTASGTHKQAYDVLKQVATGQ